MTNENFEQEITKRLDILEKSLNDQVTIDLKMKKLLSPLLIIIGFLTIIISVNYPVTYAQQEDRYRSECQSILGETPEEYLRSVGEYWNYDLKAMPDTLKYGCILKVYLESLNIEEKSSGLDLQGIQERADENLKELGNILTRDNN